MDNNKDFSIIKIVLLQTAVIIYTCSSIAAKKAASSSLFSIEFVGLYSLVLALLLIYALLWQQILKRMDMSLAYINKSTAIIWTALWAVLFFQETITIQNIMGSLVVIIGIILVFKDA